MRIKNLALSNSPHRESGAVAVLFAILSLVLVICLAFAIDLGYAWQVKRSMVKATDAAALAAAQEARNAAVTGRPLSSGLCLNTSAAIENEARQRLTDNRADSNLEFCVIGSTPTKEKGVVTVRGNYSADLSFAGVIGKNNIDVSSSSSAKWEKAKLLPIAVCAGSSQSDISDWIENVSRTPLADQTLRASSSDQSRLCSSGNSGGFGVIDLEPGSEGFPRNDNRQSVSRHCTRTEAQIETTALNALNNIGNVTPIDKDDFRCARTGQYLGTEVDRALCNAATGTQFVLPIVTEKPTQETGSGNDWIVQISGFALASFDAYTGIRGENLCSGIAAGPSRKRNLSKAQLVASRQRVRKQQRTKLRKAAACTSGDLSITGTNWPTSIQLPASPPTVYETTVLFDREGACTGNKDTPVTLTTTIEAGAGLLASNISGTGCTATGTTTIIIACAGTLNTTNAKPTATKTFAFTVAPPSDGTFFLKTRITAVTAWAENNAENNSFPRAGAACSTRTDKCLVSVEPPLPTPNFRISAAWPPTSLSGNKILLTTNVALSNFASNGKIKLELRIAPGTTGFTDSVINASVAGLPQNACSNNTNSLTNGVIVKTCTVDVLAGETAFDVTWEISPPLAGTLNVSACATPVLPTTDNNAADNGWPSTTGCSVSNTHPIVITQPVVLDPGSFREMTFSFISYYGTGSSSDITSYQICRIGIKTISDATSLGC